MTFWNGMTSVALAYSRIHNDLTSARGWQQLRALLLQDYGNRYNLATSR